MEKMQRKVNIIMKKEYLVVYEDVEFSKDARRTTKIGDTIKEFIKDYDLVPVNEIDFEKYNSDNPYDTGGMGAVFYDIDLYEKEVGDEEYCGRIMIFDL